MNQWYVALREEASDNVIHDHGIWLHSDSQLEGTSRNTGDAHWFSLVATTQTIEPQFTAFRVGCFLSSGQVQYHNEQVRIPRCCGRAKFQKRRSPRPKGGTPRSGFRSAGPLSLMVDVGDATTWNHTYTWKHRVMNGGAYYHWGGINHWLPIATCLSLII